MITPADWMSANFWNYYDAEALGKAAFEKFKTGKLRQYVQLAAEIKSPQSNPLFSKQDKRKMRTRTRQSVRGGIMSLFGGGRPEGKAKPAKKQKPYKSWTEGSSSDPGTREVNERMRAFLATNPTVQAVKRFIKRNPDMTDKEIKALEFFRGFHGHDPEKVVQMEATVIESGDYVKLGDLWGYDLTQFPIQPFSKVQPNVLCDGAGIKLCGGALEEIDGEEMCHQLFILGGNQDLEWALEEEFGIDSTTELVDLGEITNIWYVARKKQVNFQTRYYHHTFGEEEKSLQEKRAARPYLMYHRGIKRHFIVGGRYSIPFEGIRN